MALIKLSEYEQLYRPGLKPRAPCSLRAAAERGDIPGAFQYRPGGAWWIDTEQHDRIVREMSSGQIASNDEGLSDCEQKKVDEILGKLNGTTAA